MFSSTLNFHTFYYEQPCEPFNPKLSQVLELTTTSPLSLVFGDKAEKVKSFLLINKNNKSKNIYSHCTQEILNTTISNFFQKNEQTGNVFHIFVYLHSETPKYIFQNIYLNQFYATFMLLTNFDKPVSVERLFRYLTTTKNNLLLLNLVQELKPHIEHQDNQPFLDRLTRMEAQLEKHLHMNKIIQVDLTQEENQTPEDHCVELPELPEQSPSCAEDNSVSSPFSSPPTTPPPSHDEGTPDISTRLAQLQLENQQLRKELCEFLKKQQRKDKFLQKLKKKGYVLRSDYSFRNQKNKNT